MRSGEKRPIPGTNPDWGLYVPDGYDNSLVSDDGKAWDGNGQWNFDERSYDDDDEDGESDQGDDQANS